MLISLTLCSNIGVPFTIFKMSDYKVRKIKVESKTAGQEKVFVKKFLNVCSIGASAVQNNGTIVTNDVIYR